MKTLIQVSFIAQVDDDAEFYELAQKMDEAIRDHFEEALRKHDASESDLDGLFEYYGVSMSPVRQVLA